MHAWNGEQANQQPILKGRQWRHSVKEMIPFHRMPSRVVPLASQLCVACDSSSPSGFLPAVEACQEIARLDEGPWEIESEVAKEVTNLGWGQVFRF